MRVAEPCETTTVQDRIHTFVKYEVTGWRGRYLQLEHSQKVRTLGRAYYNALLLGFPWRPNMLCFRKERKKKSKGLPGNKTTNFSLVGNQGKPCSIFFPKMNFKWLKKKFVGNNLKPIYIYIKRCTSFPPLLTSLESRHSA